MSSTVNKLDYAAYWTLLRGLSANDRDMIVATADGEALWVSQDMTEEDAGKLAKRIHKAGCDGIGRGKILSAVKDDTEIVTTGVADTQDNLLCMMIVLATPTQADTAGRRTLAQSVAIVRNFLAREVRLAHELDTVSAELGDRYEELNLLYSTEENLQYFDDPAAAAAQLIEKTNLHLNVNAVILRLPDKNISVTHLEQGCELNAARAADVAAEIMKQVVATGLPMSVNDEHDSDNGVLQKKLGVKCLAIPLFDGRGVVEGALIALNGEQMRSFSNSDRNLLEVMGQRIRLVLESASDTLTGLLARHAFEQRLKAAQVMSRTTRITCAVLHINMDRLHVINDICGPHAGDAAIRAVATVLEDILDGENIAARLGGDSFGVLINNCTVKDAMTLADAICKQVAAIEFQWSDSAYELAVSIGIGTITPMTGNIDEVLSAAEIACAEAKEAGGGRTRVLRDNDTVLVMRQNQMKWIGRVQAALRESRFILHAQAIQPLNDDDKSMHHEVLIRLLNEAGDMVMPDEFLPSAERYNLMPEVDRWVIENVLERLSKHWHGLDADLREHERKYSSWAINLSGQSMCDARLMHYIVERIEHYKLPYEMLCFEVTESAAVRNLGDARRLIAALRARGCKFSLDDFGTGVSSFAYLKNLPVDYLKIDGSFVRPLLEDVASAAVVSAISQIAKAMELRTVAEFVETGEIAQRLKEIGIDFGQGYAFARPIPIEEVLEHRSSRVLQANQ